MEAKSRRIITTCTGSGWVGDIVVVCGRGGDAMADCSQESDVVVGCGWQHSEEGRQET